MIGVETSIEPPELGQPPHGEESDVEVFITVIETDGTRRVASAVIPDPSDVQLAETLLACVRRVATMRGPGLAGAVRGLIR